MNTDEQPETGGKTALEREFELEIPRILRMSDSDLEGALAALDYYLERNPHAAFRNALLAWKGGFYLEHERYDDAIRELQAADALHIPNDLHNFNTKFNLAQALDMGGKSEEAYAVLITALNEIEDPALLLDLLPALAWLSSSLGHALPARAHFALSQGKQCYGIDDEHELLDLHAEITRVTDLKHEASVRYDQLYLAICDAEGTAEKVRLAEAYIQDVRVPYFKGLAENLLARVRQEAEAKS